jgi:glycosyltransferase involved in cell wall biosynthesis
VTPLRVGLNLIPIGARAGGVGSYAKELAGALASRGDLELHLFVSRDAPDSLVPDGPDQAPRVTRLPVHLSGPPLHLAAQFGAIPALALARRLDVVHSPANAGPVRIPSVASIITLHDTIWARAPDDWGSRAAVRTMYRVALPTVRRADRVVAVSADAARDIQELFGIPAERIDVAHHGVRGAEAAVATPESELRARLGLGSAPVVLCVAQKRPYKNQEALVRALAREGLEDVRLALPGARTPYEDRLRQLAAELGVADRIHLLGWVTDADLEGLYQLAACVALPSRLEGFGLPVLEAMARGVPVACSDRTAMPEVAGDAAVLFDPDDPAALAGALRRLLRDGELRERLVALGLARAAGFTWAAAADATVASYRRALAGRGPAAL